jgi:hypothetical protein
LLNLGQLFLLVTLWDPLIALHAVRSLFLDISPLKFALNCISDLVHERQFISLALIFLPYFL